MTVYSGTLFDDLQAAIRRMELAYADAIYLRSDDALEAYRMALKKYEELKFHAAN